MVQTGCLGATGGRTLDEEMTRPGKSSLESGFVFVPAGYTLSVQWSPNATEPAGNYCANTYRNNFSTRIGHTCVDVHS